MPFVLALSWKLSSIRQHWWSAILSLTLIVYAFAGIASAEEPVASLPQAYIDTTWNPPTGGTSWAAHTSAQFTGALTAAMPGDIIVLDAGMTYIGNFRIPAKSNPLGKWIYVVSSAYGSLPAPGTRVSPSDAANMPKIVTPNVMVAIGLNEGSNHWRFVGIEIYSASTYMPSGYIPGVHFGYAIVNNWTYPPVTLPDSITFDRCYVHGDPAHDVQAGISGNWTNAAVVDSYISDIHMRGFDTQAFNAYITPGPIKLVNNYLSAAGENVMFGGAGGTNNPYVPSDIEVRNNYLYKPLSWAVVGVGIPPSPTMSVKNALELKSAQRLLFDGNTIENVWASAQNGSAIVLTVRTSQSGNVAVVNDITITNNIVQNVVLGFNAIPTDNTCGSSSYPKCTNAGSSTRWYIANNLVTFYDPTLPGGSRNFFALLSPSIDLPNGGGVTRMHDIVLQHNTAVSNPSTPCAWGLYFGVTSGWRPPFPQSITNNIWVLDNAFCRQPTGDWGQQGTAGLTQYMGSPNTSPYDLTQRFYGNVMYVPPGDRVRVFPPHNYATTVPFTYVNPGTGNYTLLVPNWTDTTDGKLAGVNMHRRTIHPTDARPFMTSTMSSEVAADQLH